VFGFEGKIKEIVSMPEKDEDEIITFGLYND
jgi:hypothetical protein